MHAAQHVTGPVLGVDSSHAIADVDAVDEVVHHDVR